MFYNLASRISQKLLKPSEATPTPKPVYDDYAVAYESVDRNLKKLVLATQAGRGGMKWVCRIFAAHENANGGGERNRLAESFYRYIKWNNLPIDTKGIIDLTRREILADWEDFDISLVSSPYFAHDFLELYEQLKPDRVIWAINDPTFTVTSFYNKGWYAQPYERGNRDLVNGLQPGMEDEWSHMFGRIEPVGEFYDEWKGLTRIGKLAWFLNEVVTSAHRQMQQIPEEKLWILRLEEADQNYAYYLRMAKAFGLRPLINENKFLSLKQFAARDEENTPKSWSEREHEEFEKYSADYISLYKSLSNKT